MQDSIDTVQDVYYLLASLCDKSKSKEPLTSRIELKWWCARCETHWIEAMNKRKRYIWCPACQQRKGNTICVYPNCSLTANYNFENCSWKQSCGSHKDENMVRKCKGNGLRKTQPATSKFNYLKPVPVSKYSKYEQALARKVQPTTLRFDYLRATSGIESTLLTEEYEEALAAQLLLGLRN